MRFSPSTGGVFCGSTNAIVVNCTLTANTCGSLGAGASGATLSDCTLAGNAAFFDGGGAAESVLNDCTLTGNTAGMMGPTGGMPIGGGAWNSTLNHCIISDNSSSCEAGGAGQSRLYFCTLAKNSAPYGGGAWQADLNNCILTNNSASDVGGGALCCTLNNCSLTGNTAANAGGGALGGWQDVPSILNNCTLTGNSAPVGGGASESTLNNCILYDNTAPDGPNYSGGTLNYCCTTPLPASGSGNIELNPQLSDAKHLSPGSPCRWAGSAAYAIGVEIDGEPWASPPSIGCDEFYGVILAPLISYPPSSQQLLSGTPLELSVQALGEEPLAYQWLHDEVLLSDGGRVTGAATSTLHISGVQASDAGAYTVTVSNAYGSTSSAPAFISVLFKTPEITTQPTDQTVLSGSTISLSVVATGSLPMTYQWLRNGHPLSDGDGITGASTATLTITSVGPDDVGVYSVAVANELGSITSLPVGLDVIMAPPGITAQPRSQVAGLGSTVSVEVQATGSQPLSFQWQFNGVDISDEPRVSGSRASTMQITNLRLSDLGSYSVIVSNALGWIGSTSAQLTTWSPALSVTLEPSELVVTWNDAGKGMTLQRTVSLSDPNWVDVAESDKTNKVTVPMTEVAGFFRLIGVSVPPPSGLVAWWSGDGDGLDLVGTSHGTLMNGAGFAQGKVGQAFSFDGVDDYVQLPYVSGDFTEGTVEFWFNLDSWGPTPATAGVFMWSCLGQQMGDIVSLGRNPQSDLQMMFGIYEDVEGWHYAHSGVIPTLSTWTHVAGTWGPMGLRIYVNGLLTGVDPYTGPMPTPNGGSVIGCGYWPYSSIQGKVDELSLYNRALTADEIKAIYDAGSAGKVKPSR